MAEVDCSIEEVEGFALYTLSNDAFSVSVIPELGGRIVSLSDHQAQKEWLDGWHPIEERRLWKTSPSETYDASPFAGIDECLPTVLPCFLEGREIPDHGELWNQAADLDSDAWGTQRIALTWTLSSLPLVFRRSVTIEGPTIKIHYALQNTSSEPIPFLWAWHPLFSLTESDQIELADQPSTCYSPEGQEFPWPEAQPKQDLSKADLADSAIACAKVFVGPLQQGRAKLHSKESTLTLTWPAELFPWAGVWISRGFTKGLHHWALEPTNAPVDRLSETTSYQSTSLLKENEIREWDLELHLESINNAGFSS